MKKLKEALHRITSLQKELADFSRLEEKTRADILSVARSDIPLDAQKQKIRDARLTLDLVDARRAKILEPREEALGELTALLRNRVEAWNSAVAKAQEALEGQVVGNTLAFFDGDERACRRWWERGNMGQLPIFHEFRQGFYPTDSLAERIGRDLAGATRDFLSFAQRHGASMKIEPATLE